MNVPPRRQPKERLRGEILTVAEEIVSQDGLSALQARRVASEAGCSVGSIYNAFGDLDELILAVNEATLDLMSVPLSDTFKATLGKVRRSPEWDKWLPVPVPLTVIGVVADINTRLSDSPELVNTDPYGEGWMIRVEPKDAAELEQLLTADEYAELLRSEGFEIELQEIYPGAVTEQGWIDLSRFSDFISGALPGVPLATASNVLVESLKETFAEFELTVWPRNWLTVVAARP